MMSSQREEAQLLRGVVPLSPEGVLVGRLVVKLVRGQCGLEGSFTTHSSAATSQSETTSPLGSTQSSSVRLVQVPAPARSPREPARGRDTCPLRPWVPGAQPAGARAADDA